MAAALETNEAIPVTETATAVTTTVISASTRSATTPSTTLATLTTTDASRLNAAFTNLSDYDKLSSFFFTYTGTGEPTFLTATNNPFSGGNNPYDRDTSNGLSTGAKAGIGVGVAALAFSIIAVALLILRMRKKEQFFKAQMAQPIENPLVPPPSYRESQSEVVQVVGSLKGDRKTAPTPIKIPAPPLFSDKASGSSESPASERRQQMSRKSLKSLRARRNSNLAPVSEECYAGDSNLAQVSEGEFSDSTPRTSRRPMTPKTPRSPRSQAFKALTGETPVATPVLPAFSFEPTAPQRSSTVPSHYSLDLDMRRPPAGGGPS